MTTDVCAAKQSIDTAARALAHGRPVLIAAGSAEQQVADVLIAAVHATPHWTAWLIKNSSGLLCAALPATRADHLELPAMVRDDDPRCRTPEFAVAVDAAFGTGTGISATDRACTARVLATSASEPHDLVRPGHVLPIRTTAHGVLSRRSNHEAAVDLCAIAGLPPVGLSGALLADDGAELRGPLVSEFAHAHGVPMVHLDDVVHHRVYHGDGARGRVRQVMDGVYGTSDPAIRSIEFEDELTGVRHTVLVGRPTPTNNPDVYVLMECPHRDPLQWIDCGCRAEFEDARERITEEGGLLVYLRSKPHAIQSAVVRESELVQACITAMVHHLGFSAVRLAGPASGLQPWSACHVAVTAAWRRTEEDAVSHRGAALASSLIHGGYR